MKKFKSDVGLWVQYIEVAKREKADALVGRIIARYVCFKVGEQVTKCEGQSVTAASTRELSVYYRCIA